MPTINRQCCPTCGRSMNMREIAIFSSLIKALFVVWTHCNKKNEYTFTRKEIKGMFSNENVTARFGDMVMFGGILYHPEGERGKYGFNIERAKMFFTGKMRIPTRALKNPITKEITFSDEKAINEIKDLTTFLDDNKEYIARYEGNSILEI